jgi:type II secretory pathway component PulM
MTTADLAINRRVTWRGLAARIVDIRWAGRMPRARIVVAGGHERWVSIAELEVLS